MLTKKIMIKWTTKKVKINLWRVFFSFNYWFGPVKEKVTELASTYSIGQKHKQAPKIGDPIQYSKVAYS